MSELRLGFEGGDCEDRREKRKKKQQGELQSRTKDLAERAHFDAPNSKNSSFRSKVIEEVLVQEEEEEEEETLNPGSHSVAHCLPATWESSEQEGRKDEEEEEANPCLQNHSSSHFPTEKFWNQRVSSEIHPLTINRQRIPRTASLDLNSHNAAVCPQFFVGGLAGIKRSPWTPNYQKGWSSERVPLPINGRQRYLCNGKMLPSKWDDAERWIGSPVSVDGTGRLVLPSYYRRPKSNSGPLGAHSPLVPCFDSGRVVNVAASSPFLAGVLVADQQCYSSARGGNRGCGGGRYNSANVESYIVQQSATVHGWSDLSSQGTAQDEKPDSKEGSIIVSPKALKKDMSTQMSPAGSTHSSPYKRSLLSSVPPSTDPIVELEAHFSKLEIRDVQVDGQVTLTRRPKKHVASERCLRNIIEWKNKTGEDEASAWEDAEASKFLSKYTREEARIRAWRNLQEVKAKAAIRKLEMRLEKERSSSMDKILNKLRSAQKKAEDKRRAVRATLASEARQTERTRRKASFFVGSGQMSFLSSCFTGHAS